MLPAVTAATLLAHMAAMAGAILAAGPAAAAATISVVSSSQQGRVVLPGGDAIEIFKFRLRNTGVLPETLIAVTFQNRTSGPGTQAQLDGEWTPLVLTAEGRGIVDGGSPAGPAAASFSGGLARFTGLQIPIGLLDTVTVYVSGAASLGARKNDVLDLRIPANQNFTFSPPASVISGGVIDPSGSFLVLGMAAAQVVVHDVATKQFAIGTQRNLALDLTLPANGYQTDRLQKLNVVNMGNAEGGVDLPGMEAWVDDGDGRFDPAYDTRLAALAFTGNRWEATGLSWPVPLTGLRVFVSVDIAEQASAARTVRLGLPVPPDIGIQMESGNDGPLDKAVTNVTTAPITVVDRVILTAGVPAPGVARPGVRTLPLLELVASNTYTVPQQMEALVFTNATLGPGTLSQRDGELQILTLREDGDDDGKLGDTGQDPVLGTAFFIGGRAAFSGFAWDLPTGATRRLFLTADVSLTGATDGDVLGVVLSGAADVGFTVPVRVSAGWPLGKATWTVDGMVAGQITNLGALGMSLGANDGPALALDLIVPRNGYADDLLESFSVVNLGTAASANLSELRLWRDGGNGTFDAGAGDDRDLGALANGGGVWASGGLTEALGASGARLFVSVLTSGSPTDSATVQLAVPVDGIAVASGNDGPLDSALPNPSALLLSTAPLLASLAISPAASTVGQGVTVRMTVRNVGGETVNAVTPSPLGAGGSGTLTPVSGPVPASAAIATGAQQVFTWTYSAGSPGDATLAGSASGTGAGSGLPRQSLTAGSNLHRIFDQADRLGLRAFDAMPLSVNRGQTDVVALYLTFSSLGGASGSDVRIRRLSVRLESGSGAGVIPSDLLGRVAVNQGGVTYLERSSLETSGSDMDLTLATPILVSATSPVAVALRLDILAGTVVPNFRVVIPDSIRFTAEDATSGAPVSVTLESGSFPVRSGLARVVGEATELDVDRVSTPSAQVGRGQRDAALLTARLTNPGAVGVGSDVRVSAFTVGLVDTNGMRVPNPGIYLEHLQVRNGPQIVADRPVAAQEESLLAITLSPLVSVPVGSPVDLRISADIAGSAALGTFRLRLADSTLFDARDANTGGAVPVRYATPALEGPAITVEARAESVLARGVPLLPAAVVAGSSGVHALDAVLRHPGGPGTARLRLDSLTVRCVDESRNPLVPATFVDALRVLWNGTAVAALTSPPAQGNTMGVPLSGLLIAPGDSATVTLVLDIQASAPPSGFELMLNASGITVSDANTGLAALPVAMPGAELPLVSGLTRLSSPARNLAAGFTDLMPPGLAADGPPITVARVTLLNLAPAGSGTIAVDHITLRAADQALRTVPMAAGALQLSLDQGATPWAQAAAGGADSLRLTGAVPLVLAPGQPLTLDVRLTPALAPAVSSFRLGFGAGDVGVVQPSNPLLQITVQPQGGNFPFWTQAGGFSPTRLAASYSNFPNPFAAGREATTFSYYLPVPGRVTLQVWTARGERVTSLQVDAPRPAGLQQLDTWDGRNGRGVAVVNGVYVAELSVAFDDGTSQRVLRLVAVVR